MKYLTIILVIFIFFLIFTASYAQKSDAPLEIFLATEDATGKTMDFITESNTTPIWYPLHPHEIDTDNWDNPALLTVTGNDSDDEQGWDINNTPYKGNPQLGKAELYTVTVSVSGEPSKDASFTIESYGGDFNGDVCGHYI